MKVEDVVSLLSQKIREGEFAVGSRMPTHREMAWSLECGVGTVTKAYSELERKGLTYGHVGKGTFVAELGKKPDPLSSFSSHVPTSDNFIDLSLNRFHHPENALAIQQAMIALTQRDPLPTYEEYAETKGRDEDLEAGQLWLSGLIGDVPTENLMVTQGAQSGVFIAMRALTKSGDAIATEAFGYPGIKAAALENGLKIHGIEMDEFGIIPAAFKEVAQKTSIKLLVTVPTNHNPTGVTQPLERRREIIDIAKAHDILIVEDGVYAPFHRDNSQSYYCLYPEGSIYLTSFSKVFSPALRVGYTVAPKRLLPRMIACLKAINWTTSTISLDVVNYLVRTGVVSSHQKYLLKEGRKRFDLARKLLSDWMSDSQVKHEHFLPHVWLRLPAETGPSAFIEKAREYGVAVIGGDRFAMNRQQDDHYVRACLMSVSDRVQLESALRCLKDLLEQSEAQSMVY